MGDLFGQLKRKSKHNDAYSCILSALNRTLDYYDLKNHSLMREFLLRSRYPGVVFETKDNQIQSQLLDVIMYFRKEVAKENIPELKSLLFVCDMFKRDFPLSTYLEEQQFRGYASTQPMYRMYLHESNVPLLVEDKNGVSIEGEIWEVNEKCLIAMDEIRPSFDRMLIDVQSPYDSELVEGYLYKYDIHLLPDCGTSWIG